MQKFQDFVDLRLMKDLAFYKAKWEQIAPKLQAV